LSNIPDPDPEPDQQGFQWNLTDATATTAPKGCILLAATTTVVAAPAVAFVKQLTERVCCGAGGWNWGCLTVWGVAD